MTGKEIANNLRHTKLKWGRTHVLFFATNEEPTFCVIGIKALEAGVPMENLFLAPASSYTPHDLSGTTVGDLWRLNDSCNTKEELIKVLEENYATKNFDVEAAIKLLRARGPCPTTDKQIREGWQKFTQSEAYLDAVKQA